MELERHDNISGSELGPHLWENLIWRYFSNTLSYISRESFERNYYSHIRNNLQTLNLYSETS